MHRTLLYPISSVCIDRFQSKVYHLELFHIIASLYHAQYKCSLYDAVCKEDAFLTLVERERNCWSKLNIKPVCNST